MSLKLNGLTVTNAINGSVTGNAGGSSTSCTGNAATATGQQSAVHFTLNTGGAGYGLVGQYNPDTHQGLFAMGAAYTLGAGGTLANFYGVSWSYDYSGRQLNTGYNLQHCMAVANAGTVYTVIGQGIWTAGGIRANGAISAGGTVTGSNFSGSHSGTSSGTNTGDQTNISGTSLNITQYTINQSLGTGNGPTFTDVYNNSWFRNNNVNTGLYNQSSGNHFYSGTASRWNITGASNNAVKLLFRNTHESTIFGSVYADSSPAIGFLSADENWALRVDASKNVQIYGTDLTVGNSTSSNIYMTDTDETTRRIHCNSGRIGFLNSSNGWGAYADNSGNWFANNLSGTNTGDQTNISGNAATATTATNFNNGMAYSSTGNVYVDTLESINTNDWLELVYYGGLGVRIGTGANGSKALYAGSLYDAGNRVYSAGNPQVNISGNAGTAGTADYAHQLKWYGAGATPTNANTFQKGILSNYYGGGSVTNIPDATYGSLYNFGGYDASSLALQLWSAVNHASTSSTRTLYFRMGNNLGFQNDWKTLLDNTNYSSYALPTTGGTISGNLLLNTSGGNSPYFWLTNYRLYSLQHIRRKGKV